MSKIEISVTEEQEEMAQLTADRIEFCAELVYEVAPRAAGRAKPKRTICELAENYYIRNQQKFIDSTDGDLLTATKGGDWWVKASWISGKWSDIRNHLATTGRGLSYTRKGCFRTNDLKDLAQYHEKRGKSIKKQGDTLSYQAVLLNRAMDSDLPLAVVRFLKSGEE